MFLADVKLEGMFEQLKSEGYVMCYDEGQAKSFESFLRWIDFPYDLDGTSAYGSSRYRFELREQ